MILDKLKVIIEADTKGLKSGVQEARKYLQQINNSAQTVGDSVNSSLSLDLSQARSELRREEEQLKALQREAEEAKSILKSFQKELRSSTLKEPLYESRGGTYWQNYIDYQANLSDVIDEQKIRIGQLNDQIDVQKDKVLQARDAIDQAKESLKHYNSESNKTGRGGGIFGGSFAERVKNIMLYRAIRSAITTITTAIREGIQYLAVYDQKMGGIAGYNKTMSQLASSFERMKITLGVTAMELVTTLQPVLNLLMNMVTGVLDGINQLVARLQGKSTYTAANPEYWKDYAEYVKESNSKLKETKKIISGFDELNTLDNKGLQGFLKDLTVEKDIDDLKALGELAPLALIPVLSLVKKLIDLFKKKNPLLDKQTDLTNDEANALSGALAPAAGIAAAAIAGLVGAIANANQQVREIEAPTIDVNTEVAIGKIAGIGEACQALSNITAQPSIELNIDDVNVKGQQLVDRLNELGQMVATPHIGVEVAEYNSVVAQVESSLNALSNITSQPTVNLETQQFQDAIKAVNTALEAVNTWVAVATAELNGAPFQQGCNEINSAASTTANSVAGSFDSMSARSVASLQTVIAALNEVIRTAQEASYAVSAASSITRNRYAAQTGSTSYTAPISNDGPSTGYASGISYKQTAANNRRATGNSQIEAKPADVTLLTASQLKTAQQVGAWCEAHPVALAAMGLSVLGGQIIAAGAAAGSGASVQAAKAGIKVIKGGKAASTAGEFISWEEILAAKKTADAAKVAGAAEASHWLDELLKIKKVSGFATGGVITKPTLGLVGEYPGAKSNPEIITPKNMMKEVVDSSNSLLADVFMQCTRQLIKSIEDKDFNVSIGDTEIAKAAVRGNNSYKMRTGRPLFAG